MNFIHVLGPQQMPPPMNGWSKWNPFRSGGKGENVGMVYVVGVAVDGPRSTGNSSYDDRRRHFGGLSNVMTTSRFIFIKLNMKTLEKIDVEDIELPVEYYELARKLRQRIEARCAMGRLLDQSSRNDEAIISQSPGVAMIMEWLANAEQLIDRHGRLTDDVKELAEGLVEYVSDISDGLELVVGQPGELLAVLKYRRLLDALQDHLERIGFFCDDQDIQDESDEWSDELYETELIAPR